MNIGMKIKVLMRFLVCRNETKKLRYYKQESEEIPLSIINILHRTNFISEHTTIGMCTHQFETFDHLINFDEEMRINILSTYGVNRQSKEIPCI